MCSSSMGTHTQLVHVFWMEKSLFKVMGGLMRKEGLRVWQWSAHHEPVSLSVDPVTQKILGRKRQDHIEDLLYHVGDFLWRNGPTKPGPSSFSITVITHLVLLTREPRFSSLTPVSTEWLGLCSVMQVTSDCAQKSMCHVDPAMLLLQSPRTSKGKRIYAGSEEIQHGSWNPTSNCLEKEKRDEDLAVCPDPLQQHQSW